MTQHLSYHQLRQKLTQPATRLAFLPVGCYEQHGPELPLDTDSLVATALCEAVCSRLEKSQYIGHVFPVVHYTPTEPNRDYCGTVHVDNSVARQYFEQIFTSIMRHPFDGLVVINGHGSVSPVLREQAFSWVVPQFQGPKPEQRRPILCLDAFEFAGVIQKEFGQAPGRHAEWTELLYTYHLLGPEYYDSARLERLETFASQEGFHDPQPAVLGLPMQFRSVDGVHGAPLPLNYCAGQLAQQAEKLWNLLVDCLVEKTIGELTLFWERYR